MDRRGPRRRRGPRAGDAHRTQRAGPLGAAQRDVGLRRRVLRRPDPQGPRLHPRRHRAPDRRPHPDPRPRERHVPRRPAATCRAGPHQRPHHPGHLDRGRGGGRAHPRGRPGPGPPDDVRLAGRPPPRMIRSDGSREQQYTAALLRHFADLRDGTHGGAGSRRDKERLYVTAVALLDPYARRALDEMNTGLLLDTGEVAATGVRPSSGGGLEAVWALSWREQQALADGPMQPDVSALEARGWALQLSCSESANAPMTGVVFTPTVR